MTKYKDILEKQENKCQSCGNEIKGQPHFGYESGEPIFATCMFCQRKMQNEKYEIYREAENIKFQEKRAKERLDWLNPNHKDYETRLSCHNGGHKVVGSYQGFIGGGCWCGYYSPEEKPLVYLDY